MSASSFALTLCMIPAVKRRREAEESPSSQLNPRSQKQAKSKYHELNQAQRVLLIGEAATGKSQRCLAEEFKIFKGQVGNIYLKMSSGNFKSTTEQSRSFCKTN